MQRYRWNLVVKKQNKEIRKLIDGLNIGMKGEKERMEETGEIITKTLDIQVIRVQEGEEQSLDWGWKSTQVVAENPSIWQKINLQIQ